MCLVLKKLMYMSAEIINVSMNYKQIQFMHVAGTMHKTTVVPAMIPDEKIFCCTGFDGGAVVVKGSVYIRGII